MTVSLPKTLAFTIAFAIAHLFFVSNAIGQVSQKTQTFTTSGTFTVPFGVNTITVEAWGAGGGGANVTTAAGGGGGGAFTRGILTVTPGSTITITVGPGGGPGVNGGASSATNNSVSVSANGGSAGTSRTGGAGGAASSINAPVTASFAGGTGGNARASQGGKNNEGGGGGGGSATTSGNGISGGIGTTAGGLGGSGTGVGGNGAAGTGSPDASPGSAPGGGGGGRGEGNSTSKSGAAGQVKLTWDCNPTLALSSAPETAAQTVCLNTAITDITYAIGGTANGAQLTGHPAGVSGSYSNGVFKISGTPTVPGTFTYTVTTTADNCTTTSLTGTITVTANATISLSSAVGTNAQNVCLSSPITTITYNIGGSATDATLTTDNLPEGVTASYSNGVFTISGTPTEIGAFDYTITTNGPCNNPSASGTITVNAIPGAPEVTALPIEYCLGATASPLTATGTEGSTLNWYTTPTGGQGSTTAPTPSTTAGGTTSFYVSQTLNGCEGPRAQIDVVVHATPLPGVTTPVVYCQEDPPSELSATGTDLLWYTAPTGGQSSTTAPTPSTETGGTTSYWVSQTLNGCEGPRAKIDVVVNTTPNAPGAITGPTTTCPGSTYTYSIAAVSGATSYTWSVPNGWSLDQGQNSLSITVTAGTTGQDGTVSVTASNACGTSDAQTLQVGVTSRPSAVITGGTTTTPICSGSSTSITGTVTATGAWTLTLSNGGGSATGDGNGTFTINVSPTSTTTYTIASLSDANCAATASELSGSAVVSTKEIVATPVINSPICSGATSISGTGENGSTITVSVNNTPLPPTTVSNGTWTISGVPALTAGDAISAEASATGKCNAVSSSVSVLAFLAPPVITYPIYAGSTSVSGTHGTNGATIRVFVNGTFVTSTTVSTGQWSVTVPTLVVNNKVSARASIAGGCESGLSNEVTVITAVTGVSGDYRSVAINGSWNDLSSWQINNSGTWATPTTAQGYPGEKTASGTVYVQSGSTIFTASNVSNVGSVVINGKLEVNNTLTINSSRNVTVNGTIQFDNDGIINAGGNSVNFSMSDNSRLITANPAGINSSGTSGSVHVTGTRTFLNTAHYTYNGTVDQVTGTGLPSSIFELGSFTINNTALNGKVSLSNSLSVFGPLNLTNGALSIPGGMSLTIYGSINTAAGTIAGTPTSILNIEDDGRSAAITNTNSGTPNAILFSGSPAVFQNIAYRRASVAATIGSDLTLYGNLLNSAGNALNFGTTTITFTGAATQSMGGLSSITYNNLIIDKTAGRVNSTNHITVKGTLTLKSGNLSTGSSRLTVEGDLLGAQPGNTFGSGNMIISTEVGAELRRFITNNNSYLFPVGDLTSRYAPVELTFTGGDISSGTRYASVNVRNSKHPNNTNTTNFITRYWIIDTDIPTPFVYNMKATYHDLGISSTDVVGTDSKILFARWKGILPSPTTPKPYWERYPSSIEASKNIFSKTGLTSAGIFTGISSNDPTVSISANPGTTVCQNATLTLTANTTADAPLTYSWNNDLYTTATITPSTTTPSTEAIPYTVTVTDGNGFMATSEMVAITTNPLPAQFTVSGGAVYCSGQTVSAPVSLSGSETGISYQLKSGTTMVQTLTGNGSALNFNNLSEAGTYTVVAVNEATGCTRTMTGSATVTINPLPTVFAVTGGGAYCSGGTGVAIGLSGSQTGVSYQLLQDGIPVGSSVPGTGNAISFGNQTQVATYTVKATNSTTTCTNNMTGSATVTINPLPTVFAVTGGGAYCSGGTGVAIGLSGSEVGINYQLRKNNIALGDPLAGTGGELNFGFQTEEGTYTVVATNTITTCNAVMAESAVVTIHSLPETTITPDGPTTFCQGSSVVLTAPSGYSYLWSNGATTQSITVSANGSYSVTVTNTTTECVATSAATTIMVNTPPAIPTISAGGPTTFCQGSSVTLTSSSASGNQWYRNGVAVGGAIAQTFSANLSGNYTVIVTDGNGCSSTSTAITVTVNMPPAVPTISAGGLTTFCTGGSVTLTSSAATGNQWYRDGSLLTGEIGTSLVVNTSGNYTVTVTDGNTCSATSEATTVTVNPIPAQPTITGANSFCTGGSVNLTSSSASGNQWYKDNELIAGATDETYSASEAGSYTVVVTENNCPSLASAAKVVTVNTPPATPTVTASGPTTFCEGGDVTLSAPSGYSSYSWSNGSTTGSIIVNESGDYSVTVTDANGCSSTSADKTVTVNPVPVAPSAPAIQNFCSNDAPTVADLVATSEEGNTLNWYRSETGGIALSSGEALETGTYFVSQTSGASCESSRTSVNVTVNQTPEVPTISGSTTFCDGGSVPLTSSSASGNQWYKDNVAIVGATDETYVVTESGSYHVEVTANGCSATSDAVIVTEYNAVTVAISATGSLTFCEGGSVVLNAPSGFTSYQWNKDGTPITNAVNNTYTATSNGSYTVTVTNSNNCSATSGAAVVRVNPNPAAPSATSPQNFCSGSNPTVADLSATAASGNTLNWYNTSTGGTALTSTVALQTGTYYVSQVSDALCESLRTEVSVVVNNSPVVTISTDGETTFCAGGSVTLNSSAANGNQWYRNGSILTGETGTSLLVNTSGSYTVTVTDGNNCSATSAATTVTVNPIPSAPSASATQSFCSGDAPTVADLIATGDEGSTLKWYSSEIGGTALASTDALQSGTYYVSQTADNCESPRTAVNVVVNTPPDTPTITTSGPTTFCDGGGVTLSAPAGYTYSWSNGATTESITVSTGGNYTVTVTDGNGCSATSAATTVTVNPVPAAPTINTSGATTFCDGGGVTLSAPAGYTYSWSNGATTESITVSTGGNYTVTVTDGNGCSATSAATTVTVNPVPAAPTAPATQTFCSGEAPTVANLSATAASGSTLKWYSSEIGGTALASTDALQSGTYYVSQVSDALCESERIEVSVVVNTSPVVTISASGATTFCAGGSVTLNSSAANGNQWYRNGSILTGETGTSLLVNTSGSYTVTVTDGNNCSATSAATTVTVNSLVTPEVTITSDVANNTTCTGTSVTFTATPANGGTAPTYQWRLNGSDIPGETGSTYTSSSLQNGAQISVVLISNAPCTSSAIATSSTITMTVNTNLTVSIPDAFTNNSIGVARNTVYRGYQPASTLTLSVQGAPENATYLWSTGATTTTITVNATDAQLSNGQQVYSVQVSAPNSCTVTTSKTIFMVDVTCGNKVQICEAGVNKCASANSVAGKLASGATLGLCPTTITTRTFEPIQEELLSGLSLKAFPNPTTSGFNVVVESDNMNERINLRVMDLYGRTIEIVNNVPNRQTLKLGAAYRPGVYFIEMIQGSQHKQLKLIKQPD